MSMQGMSNGTEQWCPVKGGGYISEVSFNRGFTVLPYLVMLWIKYCLNVHVLSLMCRLGIFLF